jgi:hypothetical protein
MAEDAKISEAVRLEVLESGIPHETVEMVVSAHGLVRQRQRKLSSEIGVELLIMMSLFSDLSLGQVVWKLMSAVRDVWSGREWSPATAGAFSQLRYQLGAAVMVDLFHRLCRPMTTPARFTTACA